MDYFDHPNTFWTQLQLMAFSSDSERQKVNDFFNEYDSQITLADKQRKRQIMVDRMPEPDVPKRRRMGSKAPIHVNPYLISVMSKH